MSSNSIPIMLSIVAVYWFAIEAAWTKSKHKGGKHVYPAPFGFKVLNLLVTPMLIYGATRVLVQHSADWWVSSALLGMVALIVFAFPATLIVSTEGITSVKLFGLRKKCIRWNDVEAVFENPEDNSLVIRDRAHDQIVHTIYHVDRAGFASDVESFSHREIHRAR